jgi:hypothetical protein
VGKPWAVVLAELGAGAFSGELCLESGSRQYLVTFAAGQVVNAASAMPADSFINVALAMGLISAAQATDADRMRLRSARDELGRLVDIAQLTDEQVAALRRGTILRRAARTLSVHAPELHLSSTTTLNVTPYGVDVRAIVYYGARTHMSDEQLAAHRGGWRDAGELDAFGFDADERAVVAELQRGSTFAQLEEAFPDVRPRTLRAIAYASSVVGAARLALGSGTLVPPLEDWES